MSLFDTYKQFPGGQYPENWKDISGAVKDEVGWRCERCQHVHDPASGYTLTVHHLDMNPGNCSRWNLLSLCQRDHLVIQAKVNPNQLPMPFESFASEKWLQPYWMAYLYSHNVPWYTIAESFGVSHRTFYRRISRFGLFHQSRYSADPCFFDNPLTPNASWVLGLIFSDGCLYGNTVELSSKDYDLLESVVDLMNIRVAKGLAKSAIRPKNKGRHSRIIFTHSHIISRLKEFGLVPAKSLTLEWPNLPIECYPHFVRGILDGDGSVQVRFDRKGQQVPDLSVWFYSGSEKFIAGLMQWLEDNSIDYSFKHSKINLYRLRIVKQDSLRRLYGILYENKECPRLMRKWEKYNTWVNTPRVRSGRPKSNGIKKGKQNDRWN